MGKRFTQCLVLAVCLLLGTGLALAQVLTTGRLIGSVVDQTGAVVVGAAVKAVDEATGRTYETKSGNDGGFVFPALDPASYTITVTMQGFKKAEYRAVKVVTGGQHGLTVKLEIGEVASTVVIEAGAEVLQTSETKVGATIMGKAITQLPFTSRDTLDLAILMPGAMTTGRPRQTSFMGMPKGAINITLDGINDQDNTLKSSDGFFTYVRPRVDTIEEFSISTAAGSASESGEGAIQIRFETKRGGNEMHGGAWWYHRNDKFNANFYFNNEKAPGQKATAKSKQRLNQFGVKVGGPIIKDKLFFFTAIDLYRNPQAQGRTRTILTSEAETGKLRYAANSIPATLPAWVTCNAPAGGSGQCVANLLQLAAANSVTSTPDPIISSYLAAIDSSVLVPGVSLNTTTSLITRSISFNNTGSDRRNFPDFRFDYNMNKNMSLTAIYHYNFFGGGPDFLNGADPTFPVAPFNGNFGGQGSNRNSTIGAWRWNMRSNMSNEVRIGLQSGPVSFFPELQIGLYPEVTTNLGTFRVQPTFNLVSQPLLAYDTQGRSAATLQMLDTFSWTRGKHNFTFGGSWTDIIYKDFFNSSKVGFLDFGVLTTDPARAIFNSTNLPGQTSSSVNSTIQSNARSLYSMLVGRVIDAGADAPLNPTTRQFEAGFPYLDQIGQHEFGIYATDNWRLFSTLTLNLGLRYEIQGAPWDKLNQYFRGVGSGSNAVAGRSCNVNNLFTPLPLASQCGVTQYELINGRSEYNTSLNNWAPSFGLAWTPNMEGSLYKWIFGGPGKSVFRAGYSISFTREGLNNYNAVNVANPGYVGSSAVAGGGTPGPGIFKAGTVLLSSGFIPNLTTTPPAFVSSFTISPQESSQTLRVYDPNLKLPYVQSWQVGWQREVTPSTVIEVRYVGNHGTGLWRNPNLNEINIFQPNMTVGTQALTSFLTEFKNAQSNLTINGGSSFANLNPGGGTVPLPIITAAFTGSFTGAQTAAGFVDAALISNLKLGLAGTFASTLATTLDYWNGIQNAGMPANFWRLNPDARGGATLFGNWSQSTFNGLQIEFRRKPVKGLQFNGNYSFSKSLTNQLADSSTNQVSFSTLRNMGYDKGPSPWDIRHQFKLQLIYELPFGPGRKWSSSMGWMNRVIEGWELNTITRWQSGRLTQITGGQGGTFNAADGGVELIGITPKQLQEQLSVRKTANGLVYWFPASMIDPGGSGQANSAVLKACSTPGQFCQRLFVYGPSFFRADWSIGKRTKISEKVNIEYRAEFLDAFNNVNFLFGGSSSSANGSQSLASGSFGQIGNAYQDVSTTNDNGGRIIQMVLRINF